MGNAEGRVGIVEGVTLAALLGGITTGAFCRIVIGVRELQGVASVGAVLGVLAYGAAIAVLRWAAGRRRSWISPAS